MRPRASQVNFDKTDISDPLIRLNSGQTGANDKDSGIVIERGSDTNVAIIWDESADELAIVNTAEDGSTSGNITVSSYANVRANTFYGDGSNLTGVVSSYGDSDVATYLSSNGYGTSSTIIASITDSAPGTLDTLNELAAALGDDANFSTTISTQIGAKLDSSSYTAADVLTKIKTVDGTSSGLDADLLDSQEGSYYLNYNNFSNKPTIPTVPTNVSAFTNDAGYITSADGGNASTLDSLDSTQFLRSDADDTKTGNIVLQAAADVSNSTTGLFFETGGGYTDGRYRTRFRKQDVGGGIPLYIDQSSGTANSYTAQARFGTYSGNSYEFEVFGDIKANGNVDATGVFNGTATSAQYADLAEKYTSGAVDLLAGTAVAVGTDDCCEVVPATASNFCIGVVSTDPAYMMNSEAEGQYIGLKGRLPVRVKGPVLKGQAVYAWENGVSTTLPTSALVGIALESNSAEEEKLVECVLKV